MMVAPLTTLHGAGHKKHTYARATSTADTIPDNNKQNKTKENAYG